MSSRRILQYIRKGCIVQFIGAVARQERQIARLVLLSNEKFGSDPYKTSLLAIGAGWMRVKYKSVHGKLGSQAMMFRSISRGAKSIRMQT
jgi:hypothetical protein